MYHLKIDVLGKRKKKTKKMKEKKRELHPMAFGGSLTTSFREWGWVATAVRVWGCFGHFLLGIWGVAEPSLKATRGDLVTLNVR